MQMTMTQRTETRSTVLGQFYGIREIVDAVEVNVAVGNYTTAVLCVDDLVAAAKLARRGIKALED